jgi:FtsH-binding integral membrane protein
MAFWFIGRRTSNDTWTYVSLDVFALLYFYSKWAAPNAQHRTLHFILMCAYLVSTLFVAFQLGVRYLISPTEAAAYYAPFWWWNLIANVCFAFALLVLTIYGLLRRRAARDPKKWQSDVETWFGDADGSVKKD